MKDIVASFTNNLGSKIKACEFVSEEGSGLSIWFLFAQSLLSALIIVIEKTIKNYPLYSQI